MNSALDRVASNQQDNQDLRVNPNIPMQDRDSIMKLWGVINSGKPYSQILEFIQNEIQESTRVISFNYEFDCFLADGAYAISRAVEGKVGFTNQQNSGPSGKPPRMIDVAFADGTHIKVPFGKINLPIFGEKAFVDMGYNHENQKMYVNGQCQKRYQRDLDKIIDEAKKILKEDSIYKNQAIKFIDGEEPVFLDLSNVDKTKLFLTPEAKFATEPIEARIERTAECVRHNIDIKFGVLLEGAYGTGKTAYAFKLAKKAITNNWTFIYCENAEDSLAAMQVAQRFCNNGAGVVLFIEDIDRVLNKRDETTNKISLLMDGGESKNLNIITILTTNHLENIDPTFLRGKRIGSIVTLTHPDAETAEEILRSQLTNEAGDDLVEGDISKAAEKIVELRIVPAFISEITDRVKTHLVFSGRTVVTEKDILSAIATFERQMEVAKPKVAQPTMGERLATVLQEVVGTNPDIQTEQSDKLDDIKGKVEYMYNNYQA